MRHPSSAILHGCFSRFTGDTTLATDFHSDEWTLVRNKRNKGKDKKIFKSDFGICQWKTIPNEEVNFVVTHKGNEMTYS